MDAKDLEECQEAELMKTFKTQVLPTREAVEEHRVDHYPYREQCDECVEGAARERAHLHVKAHSREAVISIDYLFVLSRGICLDEEQLEE